MYVAIISRILRNTDFFGSSISCTKLTAVSVCFWQLTRADNCPNKVYYSRYFFLSRNSPTSLTAGTFSIKRSKQQSMILLPLCPKPKLVHLPGTGCVKQEQILEYCMLLSSYLVYFSLKYILTKFKGCTVPPLKSQKPTLSWSKNIQWIDPWLIPSTPGALNLVVGTEQGLFQGTGSLYRTAVLHPCLSYSPLGTLRGEYKLQ